jgi:hypothetical protein
VGILEAVIAGKSAESEAKGMHTPPAGQETSQLDQPKGAETGDLSNDLYVEQFSSLRSEIEKRLDIRQATMTFTLVLAGSVLSVAAQPGISAATAFYYPVIALFLAAAWTHNDAKIGQISQFIKAEVEPHMPFVGWEAYRKRTFTGTHPLTVKGGLITFSTKGVFLSTEALALLIGTIRSSSDLLAHTQAGIIGMTVTLFLAGGAATIWSYTLLQHQRG